MDFEKFKYQFHMTWHKRMKPFIESEECDKIYAQLKKDSKRGKMIAPESSKVFRCFKETPLDQVKVVLIGMSPYHTFKNSKPVADGLLMGCTSTGFIQPSLDQFYEALERELYNGLSMNYVKDPDLTYLAHQGVLLLNAALTVEKNKAGSHLALWQPFMKYLFEKVLFDKEIIVVFLGKDAAKLQRYMPQFTWTFTISHPASASYSFTEWDSEGVFRQINQILLDRSMDVIDWLNLGDNIPF